MSKAFVSAVRLLARREHSAKELYNKLRLKGYTAEESNQAINECQALDLQNDLRYAQAYTRRLIQRGCGPLKLEYELKKAEVAEGIISSVLEEDWMGVAQKLWQKKFASQELSFEVVQKQKRFLQMRGFDMPTIHALFKKIKAGDIDAVISQTEYEN
jgi:regulatory protein